MVPMHALIRRWRATSTLRPGSPSSRARCTCMTWCPFRDVVFDTSHIIDKLSFGVEYPGMANPLDKTRITKENVRNPAGLPGAYQYFLKVGGHPSPH